MEKTECFQTRNENAFTVNNAGSSILLHNATASTDTWRRQNQIARCNNDSLSLEEFCMTLAESSSCLSALVYSCTMVVPAGTSSTIDKSPLQRYQQASNSKLPVLSKHKTRRESRFIRIVFHDFHAFKQLRVVRSMRESATARGQEHSLSMVPLQQDKARTKRGTCFFMANTCN